MSPTKQANYLLPAHVTNVASRTIDALAEASGVVLQNAPRNIKQAVLAIRDLSTDLHKHAHTVHGIKDLVLAQNRDVHVLSLKNLVNAENIDQEIFPEDERAFAHNYFKQKKKLLFLNSNGVFCAKYPPSQQYCTNGPAWLSCPSCINMRTCARRHGSPVYSKVVARLQERHTCPGIRRTVGQYVSQCLTCRQVRDKPGDVHFHIKNIQSGYFNELVQ